MKRIKRNQKGISLIALSITVIVLVIITNIVVYNLQDNLGIERLRNMQNDIENLRDKIDLYYLQYGTIPIVKPYYNNQTKLAQMKDLMGVNDTGDFYVIDLSALENLTLTYGEDYRYISNDLNSEKINSLEDIYIINESSHNVFYAKGITVDDVTYYTDYTTNDEGYIDTESIEIKYVDGIKIPNGYKYKSNNSEENLVIIDEDEQEWKWINVDTPITELPLRLTPIDGNIDAAIESINRYGGYYTAPGYKLLYINSEEITWSPTYDKETMYTDKNGDTAYIPKGFQVSRTAGSDTIADGLVARDENEDDRYVWVEVPKSIYKTVMSSEDYTNIEKDMQDYAKDYRNDNYIDEDSDEKNNMLKSVYENGGFWVSQYEIGTDTPRGDSSDALTTPVSKKNVYPYNYISYQQAKTEAEKMSYDTGRTSSLLYGIQWDLMLKFIENIGNKTKDEITTDSTGWGNYLDSDFYIYDGKYYYNSIWNEVNGATPKEADNSKLITTGTTIRNSALNIYDIAGNVTEWTHEKSTTTPYQSACLRGGYFQNSGKGTTYPYPASGRGSAPNSGVAMMAFGFRVTIY